MGSSAAAIAPSIRAVLSIIIFISLFSFIDPLRNLQSEVLRNLAKIEKFRVLDWGIVRMHRRAACYYTLVY